MTVSALGLELLPRDLDILAYKRGWPGFWGATTVDCGACDDGREGLRFESLGLPADGADAAHGGLAQSVRASGLHPEGHRFEPCTPHEVRTIALPSGHTVLISEQDFELASHFRWFAKPSARLIYVAASTPKPHRKTIYLHRVLMNAGHGWDVDHINGNPLDNRRPNLRLCTHAQNMARCRSYRPSKYGFRGVSQNYKSGRFMATISIKDKKVYLGTRDTAEQAAHLYDFHALRLHGEFARLNFAPARDAVVPR